MKIKCNECGAFLFDTDTESLGAAGVQAQEKGFIYKNACLFSAKYTSLFFCSNECGKSFYHREIPKDEDVSATLKDMREKVPEYAADLSKKLAALVESFNKNNKKS
jgi:hypothetical protein